MTRKHFKALAEALYVAQPLKRNTARYSQWQADRKHIADTCSRFNDNFNYEKFIEACENGK